MSSFARVFTMSNDRLVDEHLWAFLTERDAIDAPKLIPSYLICL